MKFCDEQNTIDPAVAITSPKGHAVEFPTVRRLWPWLTREIVTKISIMYYDVHAGTKTIEDIAAYVRSVEPPEESERNVENAEKSLDSPEQLVVA